MDTSSRSKLVKKIHFEDCILYDNQAKLKYPDYKIHEHCPVCNRFISSKQSIYKHLQEKHDINLYYTCSKCKQDFIYLRTIKYHLFRKHNVGVNKCSNNLIWYKCMYCRRDKIISNVFDFKSHIFRCHLKVERYQCKVCLKTAYDKDTISKHLLGKHKIDSKNKRSELCSRIQPNYDDLGY